MQLMAHKQLQPMQLLWHACVVPVIEFLLLPEHIQEICVKSNHIIIYMSILAWRQAVPSSDRLSGWMEMCSCIYPKSLGHQRLIATVPSGMQQLPDTMPSMPV